VLRSEVCDDRCAECQHLAGITAGQHGIVVFYLLRENSNRAYKLKAKCERTSGEGI